MARYNTYTADNKIIVVSRYAGKTVRGVAKCDPQDMYNGVYGERLAKARCDKKVCEKRKMRAAQLANEAAEKLIAAQARLEKMMAYLKDTTIDLEEAEKLVADIEAEAGVVR